METGWTEEMYAALLADTNERIRLSRLTDAALVWEAVERGLVDDNIVSEMADRLDPQWANREEGKK